MKRKLGFVAIMTLSTAFSSQVALADSAQAVADGNTAAILGQPSENYSPVAFLTVPSNAPITKQPIETIAVPGENYSPVAFLPAAPKTQRTERMAVSSAQSADRGVSLLTIGL